MFGQIVGFFIPKVGELLVDYVHENIKDFKFTLDSLEGNLNLLSARASDVELQIKNASGKKRRKREVENWLTEVKSIEKKFRELENEVESEGFIGRFMVGGQAAQLNAKVDKLVKQSGHVVELLIDVYETKAASKAASAAAFCTTTLIGKGFEENLERIWRLLVIDKVSSIVIRGMGGVGKTTLTKHIHNRLLEETQERVIWVTVSQAFTIKKLQDEIARVVGVDLSDEHDQHKRAARLHQSLSHKKNVLILDDVWGKINLEKVGYPISEGFRLIITTRSLKDCRQTDCQEVITLGTLEGDAAWYLFNETLGEKTKLPPQVEEIAKATVKLCNGLPLWIITLAGSMRGETAIHVWRNAMQELKESIMRQGDMEEHVFNVLKYSFDRLNPKPQRDGRSSSGYNSLQLCFLYCSLYPEDYEIEKEELIRKFISEGFMDKGKGSRAQYDQSHSILDKLVSVCLLESTVSFHGGVRGHYVKMHDLIRAMALEINKGKTMVKAEQSLKEIPNKEEWTEELEIMSLMRNSIERIPDGTSPNCPKLSTLLLQNNPLRFLPDSIFSKMHGLCTLDLSQTEIWFLPNSLSNLENLQVLLLKGCRNLEDVPYLGKLKALRELNLSGTRIRQVPQGMKELVDLKFLSIDAEKLKMFPEGLLLKFPHLQYLKFPCHIELPVEEIKSLKQLEELGGRVRNVCNLDEFVRSGKCRVYHTFFHIVVRENAEGRSGLNYTLPDYGYNDRVILDDYNLKKGVLEKDTILGEDIKHLEIRHCDGLSNCLLDDFQSNPGSLVSLDIYFCGGIECILTSEQLIMAPQESRSPFSTLERISLYRLGDFKGVIHKRETGAILLESPPPRQDVFLSLRELSISHCHKMKKLGLPVLSEFPNLETIKVVKCDEIEEIIEISNDEERRGEGEERSVSLPKLKVLELNSLPRLKSICNTTMICTSIRQIDLLWCPTLKKLPLDIFPRPAALEKIRVPNEQWWDSLEWEHPSHPHLLRPFLRFSPFR